MAYSITTNDGITINNIPDDVRADDPSLKARVADIRAQGGAQGVEPDPTSSQKLAAETGVGEAFLVATGKGLFDIGRGLGIIDPATGVEKEAFGALEEEHPATTFVGEAVGQTIPFVPLAALPAAAGTAAVARGVAPLVVRGAQALTAAVAGGVEGGIIAEGTGEDPAFGAGVGAGVAGTVEAFAPVLGRLARKVFARVRGTAPVSGLVTPEGTPTPEMMTVLDEAGIAWDDMKTATQEFIATQEPGAAPEQVARLAGFEEIGAPALKGQVTKDFAQRKTEQALAESGTEGAAEPIRQTLKRQSEAIRGELDNIVDGLGITGETGAAVKEALSGRRATLKADRARLYKELGIESEKVGTGGLSLRKEGVHGIKESGQRLEAVEFTVLSEQGDELADMELALKGDTVFVESISSLKGRVGEKGTLGAKTIKQIKNLVAKEFPGATKISGKRVSGIHAGGRKGVAGEMLLPKDAHLITRPLAPDRVPIVTSPILDALPDKGTIRDIAALSPNQFKALNDLLVEFGVEQGEDAVESALKRGVEIDPLGFHNFESFRKRLNGIASSDQSGAIQVLTGPLKDSLDAEIDIAVKAMEGVGGDIAQKAKAARLSHAALRTEFDEKKITSKLIDPVKRGSDKAKIEASEAFKKVMAAPIEDLDRVITSLKAAGPDGAKALQEMQGRAVLDLVDSAFSSQYRQVGGERIFGAGAFSKQYEKVLPKLQALFADAPKALARLENVFNRAQDIIPPGGAVPKGSAGFFVDALNKIGVYSVATKIPFAREVFEIARQAGGSATARAQAKKTLNAKPDVLRTAQMIQTEYPQIAASLGIAALVAGEGEE